VKPRIRAFDYPCAMRALRTLYRLAVNGTYRRGIWLQWRRPAGLFQPFAATRADRYPVIFRFVRDRLGDRHGLRLLSFGCATGEEVFTLRQYFPAARIKGIDIDPRNIAEAARRRAASGDAAIAFEVADSAASEPTDAYDAVFCMAVLRHAALATAERCDPILRFADFERAVGDLARCLKPGGLLALRYSNFRFADAAASEAFETVLRIAPNPPPPLFGRDNRRRHGLTDDEVVFRKRTPRE
jgi:2-polyprenyl-3-methyl-5-hydroxy-6-metoxy-1,4-benzoquinol methylase